MKGKKKKPRWAWREENSKISVLPRLLSFALGEVTVLAGKLRHKGTSSSIAECRPGQEDRTRSNLLASPVMRAHLADPSTGHPSGEGKGTDGPSGSFSPGSHSLFILRPMGPLPCQSDAGGWGCVAVQPGWCPQTCPPSPTSLGSLLSRRQELSGLFQGCTLRLLEGGRVGVLP